MVAVECGAVWCVCVCDVVVVWCGVVVWSAVVWCGADSAGVRCGGIGVSRRGVWFGVLTNVFCKGWFRNCAAATTGQLEGEFGAVWRCVMWCCVLCCGAAWV